MTEQKGTKPTLGGETSLSVGVFVYENRKTETFTISLECP
ncbi:MAG: hypothetical protein ACI9VM_000569 [Candidatus Azotimanducaceae bacterium]|jgi:hypothetical protein